MLGLPSGAKARRFSEAYNSLSVKQKVIAQINAEIYSAVNHGYSETNYNWDPNCASDDVYRALLPELIEYYADRGYQLDQEKDIYWSSRAYNISWVSN